MKIVVVVDVGAWAVKVLVAADGRIIKKFQFPSAVGLETNGALSTFRSGNEEIIEVRPKIDGTTYRVSLRQNQQVADHSRPTPGDDFQISRAHDALLAAALHAAEVPHIDVLVIGTPVHTYLKHAENLKKWSGTVDFGLGKRILVVKTLVLPQPYGSLLAGKNERVIEREEHINHIILDVGHYSTDVLTTKGGLAVNDDRSFGIGFGTAVVYQKIADMIASDLRLPVTDLDRIEYSIRSRSQYIAHSRHFDLNGEYLQRVQAHIEVIVSDLYGRIKTTEDISSVLLTGGGSGIFERAVRKIFRSTRVCIISDPIHANARGYLIAGHSSL
ncbi:hypothetical protein LMG28614_05501 [Paraburkholderia ultramafica]|uniref:Uncharacterized protein n=1 Tax=Paraburkholderia ultramafica TaxID=1544867 RepID=A0A6S7BIY4_9BURK|nr:ParM/StbA family protein [Paraburkholderia ultramafica]CAB3801820.1 hypothetical protein LMG28614_05501 [Paraburkholderia ultramafica]